MDRTFNRWWQARGDSVSALQWAETTRFRSNRVNQAASVYLFQMSIYAIETVASVHLPRESNTRADDRSRGVLWSPMRARYTELERVRWWEADTAELILLCDPNVKIEDR